MTGASLVDPATATGSDVVEPGMCWGVVVKRKGGVGEPVSTGDVIAWVVSRKRGDVGCDSRRVVGAVVETT